MVNLYSELRLRCTRRLAMARVATLALAGGISACTGTQATGAWQDPRPADLPYDNVLIVMVNDDANLREDMEQLLRDGIASGGSKAHAAFFLEKDLQHAPRTQASMLAMVKQTSADALLVVRVTDEVVKPGMTKEEAYINIGPQVTIVDNPNSTEVWASNYTIGQTPGQFIAKVNTTMQAILYDIKDNGRGVYKIVVSTKTNEDGGDSDDIIANKVSTQMLKKLQQAKLIR